MSTPERSPSVSAESCSTQSTSANPVVQPPTPVRRIVATRRRLTPAQTSVMATMFDAKTHPTREERALLAAELNLEIKAVNSWFQNRRRSLKKQTASWPGKDNFTGSRYTLGTSRPFARTSSSVSLDSFAASRERPHKTSSLPLPGLLPTTPRKRSFRSDDEPKDLWEHLLSSPPQPPSSPAAECMRLSTLVARTDSRRSLSLEWACANARARNGRKRSRRPPREDEDVPMLILDAPPRDMSTPTHEVDTDSDEDEVFTPGNSSKDLAFMDPADGKHIPGTEKVGKAAQMEAAMALLGFAAPIV